MPVSKNHRKNSQSKKRKANIRDKKTKLKNSATFVLASGLKGFADVLTHVRKASSLYVTVTRNIPDYKESNPDLLPGLTTAIPILKEITAERDSIEREFIALRETNQKLNEFDYMELMQRFEAMSLRLGCEFMDAFMPIFDSLEALAESGKIAADNPIVNETRTIVEQYKPKFTTDLQSTSPAGE